MKKLNRLVQMFANIDIDKSMQNVFAKSFIQNKVKQINIDQLDEGKGAKGQQLRTNKAVYPSVYAAFTINEKKKKGQPFDRVTLKDTGKFRSSFKVRPFPGHAIIDSNTQKPDGDIEDNIDVSAAMGIMPDNMQGLIMSIVPEIQTNLRKHLGI